jgi:hypothetical protein
MKKQDPALEAAIAAHLARNGVTRVPESRRVIPGSHWKYYIRGNTPPGVETEDEEAERMMNERRIVQLVNGQECVVNGYGEPV